MLLRTRLNRIFNAQPNIIRILMYLAWGASPIRILCKDWLRLDPSCQLMVSKRFTPHKWKMSSTEKQKPFCRNREEFLKPLKCFCQSQIFKSCTHPLYARISLVRKVPLTGKHKSTSRPAGHFRGTYRKQNYIIMSNDIRSILPHNTASWLEEKQNYCIRPL